jgi:prepilin-type N-terminal cleavage/methylation domain-containing protein
MQRKGFTLVEIMIVVAIIGILIAIAVPGFLRAREISRRNACQENQSKIDGAIQQYILEWRLSGVGPAGDDTTFLSLVDEPAQELTTLQTWMDTDSSTPLVGEDEYIRFPPICPAGGLYTIQDPADPEDEQLAPFPVFCSLYDREDAGVTNRNFWHVYPGVNLEDAGT